MTGRSHVLTNAQGVHTLTACRRYDAGAVVGNRGRESRSCYPYALLPRGRRTTGRVPSSTAANALRPALMHGCGSKPDDLEASCRIRGGGPETPCGPGGRSRRSLHTAEPLNFPDPHARAQSVRGAPSPNTICASCARTSHLLSFERDHYRECPSGYAEGGTITLTPFRGNSTVVPLG